MSATMGPIRLGGYAVILVAALLVTGRVGVRAIPLCDGYCSASTACEDECLDNLDNLTTCEDYGICAPDCSEVCGPDVDCNTECSGGSGDCADYNGGQSNGECYGACGDGMCQMDYEDCATCAVDCGGSCQECATYECHDDSECDNGNGYQCIDGCCVAGCDSEGCGGGSRSCSNWYLTCNDDGDCCNDEFCGWTGYYGDRLCYKRQ
jgi:hypothetical protein